MNTSEKPKTNDMGIEIKCENCVDKIKGDKDICTECKKRDLCHFYPIDYVMANRIYQLQNQLYSIIKQ